MACPVVLDACVLIPMLVVDILLRLGSARQFRPLWSEEILDEIERNLVAKLNVPPAKARRRLTAMRRCFPDALVRDYESLIPAMTNEPKDRHVLAAAVRSGAELIVTFNRKDFPAESVAPYDLDVRSPDEFLLDQLNLDADVVVAAVRGILRDAQHPAMTLERYLAGLSRCGLPVFARATAGHMSER